MADNKVNFLRGTSAEYEAKTKDNDTFYYTTDDGKLYLGETEITSIEIDDTSTTATDKTWSAKKISDSIPTELPANGGNSDTVNGKTVQLAFFRGISGLNEAGISVSATDTADAIWKAIPAGSVFVTETQVLTDASWNFPAETFQQTTDNTSHHSILIIKLSNNRPAGIYLYPKEVGKIYYAYVDTNGSFSGIWKVVGEGCNAGLVNSRHSGRIATKKADGNYWSETAENINDAFIQWDGKKYFVLRTVGGNKTMVDNAATLETHPASDFVLKTDYDALVARVAALESK